MNLIFVALPGDKKLLAAYRKHLAPMSNVAIVEGDITKLKSVDAVVSPANSFGFMDGGVDAAYIERFPGIQRMVQHAIQSNWNGELPVGCAFIQPTEDFVIPLLIVAPTMRVPMQVASTVNAYLAARAAILAARHCDRYVVSEPRERSIAFPGLCTGTGGMDPDISCRQIKQAILDLDGFVTPAKTTNEAWNKHFSMVDRNARDHL